MNPQLQLSKYDLGYEGILRFLFKSVWFGHVAVDGLEWIEIDLRDDLRRIKSLTITSSIS